MEPFIQESRRRYRNPGPSPAVPLLLVAVLGWMVYNETLLAWYETFTGLAEALGDWTVVLLVVTGLLMLLVLIWRWSEVVLVALALAIVIFLMHNLVAAMAVLLPAAYAAVIWFRGQKDGSESHVAFGLGFFVMLLLCLVLCCLFNDNDATRWVSFTMLLVCILFFNLLSSNRDGNLWDKSAI